MRILSGIFKSRDKPQNATSSQNCDIPTSDNLVIYGHHIKGGRMFGALEDYKSKGFYEKHKTIQFDTLTEQDKYNPYTLTINEGHYYLSFKDGHGKQQNIEIDEMLYQTFDRFELEDISHLNRLK